MLANLTVLVLLQRPVNAMELDENVNIGDHGKVGIHARSHVVKESPDEHGHVWMEIPEMQGAQEKPVSFLSISYNLQLIWNRLW